MLAPLAALLVLFAGLWLGGHPTLLPSPIRNLVVDEDRALRAEVIDSVEDNFHKDVDRQRLEAASVDAMIRSLGDQYSHYFSPSQAPTFRQSLENDFEGIGVQVEQDRRGLRVMMVFDESPARRAGIKQGEVITGVDGDSIAGQAVQVATSKIVGRPGTSVRLTLRAPDGTSRTLKVKRARVEVPAAQGRLVTEDGAKLGVVELMKFTPGAHGELRKEVDELLDKGARGLVLDLRGNPGGLLDEAVLVSSQFVEDGRIVSTKGRRRAERVFKAEGDAIDSRIAMVVLVDRSSASASEIVTGALRDNGRATVVGETTFGKGVFQEVDDLSNGGALSLTVGSYYLPKGDNLADNGIKPAIKARDNPRTERDEALPVALDALVAGLR